MHKHFSAAPKNNPPSVFLGMILKNAVGMGTMFLHWPLVIPLYNQIWEGNTLQVLHDFQAE